MTEQFHDFPAALSDAGVFLDAAPDPIVVVDDDGVIVFVNQQTSDVLGYKSVDIVGSNVDALVPGNTRTGHRAHRQAFARDPRWRSMGADNSRVVALDANGHEVPVEVSLSPIEVDGRPMVMAALRDVSSRLKAEDRLKESEQSFRAAFDDAPVAMAMLELESGAHLVIKGNESLRQMLGVTAEELLGLPIGEFVLGADLAPLVDLIEGNESTTTEVRIRNRRGGTVWAWAHSGAILVDSRRCALVHIVDVTGRVEAEADRDHRERFLVALGDIRSEIVTERTSARVLDLITTHCTQLWPGSSAIIAYANAGGDIEAQSVRGDTAEYVEGQTLNTSSTAVGAALRTRTTVGVDDVNDGSGTTLVAPFTGVVRVEGALIVVFPAQVSPANRAMVEALAGEAALSIELEQATRERRRQLVTTDRERIARDLHDFVIQRLYAAGMRLQAAIGTPERLTERANDVIHELDETISEIRSTIFRLTEPDTSLREQLRAMLETFVAPFDTTLSTTIVGEPASIPDDVAVHLLATLNEAVSNALRHADPSEISVSVDIADRLTLTVADDGSGIGQLPSQGRGLTNIAERAAAVGGTMTIESPTEGGTKVTWTAPLGLDLLPET